MTDAPFQLTDLGRMSYARAFEIQCERQREVIEARDGVGPSAQHLLLVEHDPPVITVSRRRGADAHLVATPGQLEAAGVEVAETNRGGDITYHGPGQLVVYPILDLNRLQLRLHGYMRFLEEVVIRALAAFGIEGHRDACATGVWVGGSWVEASDGEDEAACTAGFHGDRKICAMGVRVSRWVSMHGLALNVNPNMDHFNLIVPCGLVNRGVTSMHRESAETPPTMESVKAELVRQFDMGIRERLNDVAIAGGEDQPAA